MHQEITFIDNFYLLQTSAVLQNLDWSLKWRNHVFIKVTSSPIPLEYIQVRWSITPAPPLLHWHPEHYNKKIPSVEKYPESTLRIYQFHKGKVI